MLFKSSLLFTMNYFAFSFVNKSKIKLFVNVKNSFSLFTKCKYRDEITNMFNKNIKNKEIKDISKSKNEGNWLEEQMGISANSLNAPDILGYEMKKYSNKITLGDYSASEYIYQKKTPHLNKENNNNDDNNNDKTLSPPSPPMSRNEFICFFGKSNPKKNGRYSWCGTSVPKYNEWNNNGQILQITDEQDICIYYSYIKDQRHGIEIPYILKKKEKTMVAIWKKEKIKKNIENKFNQRGFFICKKTGNTFQEIFFGKPFDYNYFLDKIKTKQITFESSMKEGCSRNYSCFRASVNDFWKELFLD
jgi:hypothetical protein